MRFFQIIMLLAFAISTSLITTLWDTAEAADLFGTSEKRSKRLKPFPKWTDVLSRYGQELTATNRCDTGESSHACALKEWNKFLNSLRGQDKVSQIRDVNSFFNKVPYITDPVNWGLPDYWAVPVEFHARDGDCEDYAITKYYALKALGFSGENMRIVVLNDRNLGLIHAILAVYHGGSIYILDNQINSLVRDKDIYHYEPVYSINESYWWRHR